MNKIIIEEETTSKIIDTEVETKEEAIETISGASETHTETKVEVQDHPEVTLEIDTDQ